MTHERSRYPIHFAVPAWGSDYVQTYLDVCLPAQLSPGNLGSLSDHDGHRYTIYTRNADVSVIRAAPSFRRLEAMLDVRIEILSDRRPGENKYHVKTDCYQHALRAAVAEGGALFALNCDMVLADGFVAEVVRRLNDGIRLIEVPGSRTIKSGLSDKLTDRYRSADGISISIDPTTLAKLWLSHRHPQLDQHTLQGPIGAPFHPSHLIWNVGAEGVIIRAFHVYPIVTRPLDPDVDFATLDDDLAANMAVDDSERYFAHDSRDLFCCELSPADYDVGPSPARRGDLDAIVAFYLTYSKENIDNLRREMVVTGSDPLGPSWPRERAAFARFVDTLLDHYAIRRGERIRAELQMPAYPTDGQGATDALSELGRLRALGEHPPAELRERCALAAISRGTDGPGAVIELCNAMMEQGKHIPLTLEEKALAIHLADAPDRIDLQTRLKTVKSAIRNLS